MKRDMALVRKILLGIEAGGPQGWDPEGADELYHLAILIDSEMVEGAIGRGNQGYPIAGKAIRLTWKGHDLVDSLRDDAVWKRVVAKLATVSGSVTIDLLKELASAALKAQLGLGG